MAKATKNKDKKIVDEKKVDEILSEVEDPKDVKSLDPVETELKKSHEQKKKKEVKKTELRKFDKFK